MNVDFNIVSVIWHYLKEPPPPWLGKNGLVRNSVRCMGVSDQFYFFIEITFELNSHECTTLWWLQSSQDAQIFKSTI